MPDIHKTLKSIKEAWYEINYNDIIYPTFGIDCKENT